MLHEILNIIPSLPEGVFVHLHDIFTPRDYPEDYVLKHMRLWNEQYILEALLTHSNRYNTVAALNYLKNEHYQPLAACCPYLRPISGPSSFYFQVAA